MTYIEVGPDEPLPPMTEEQLRQLGDILAAVDARMKRERLKRERLGPMSSRRASSNSCTRLAPSDQAYVSPTSRRRSRLSCSWSGSAYAK